MFALIELSGEDGLKIKWDLMFLNGMLEFSNQERRAKQAPFSLDVEKSVAPLALGFFFFFVIMVNGQKRNDVKKHSQPSIWERV